MLIEKQISDELRRTLERYKELNGTITYVILKYDDENVENIYRLCQAAAIEGLKTLKKHDEEFYKTHGYSKESIKQNLRMYDIFNEFPKGEILTIEEFFGPYFDIEKKKLIVRGRHKDFLNTYFYVDAEEKEENKIFDVISVDKLPNYDRLCEIYKYSAGYAKCFIEPPYGFRAEKLVINQLFLDLNRFLFYDFKYPLTHIYLWDENCSRYFKPGMEWWGAYLWTVLIQEKKEIVIIAASSTD
ncbi:MAG: hypothetical protein ACTSR3_04870 [Candidatus Helarchaeota archaeon]